MRSRFFILILFNLLGLAAQGQMLLRGDTLLGNEWIDYDKTYYRMDVVVDGLHKISGSALAASGIQLPLGEKWQLWFMGEEVPLYVSDDDDFGDDDMIIFYGYKNRSGLDSLLFKDKSDQLNPRYSLFTDTSSYYLTSSAQEVLRLEDGAIANPHTGESLPYFRKSLHIDSNRVFHSAYFRTGTQKIYNSEFDRMAGFAAQNTARYIETVSLPNQVYIEDDSIQFSLRLASSYSNQNEELIVRYQLTTHIFEDDSLKSFEVADKSFNTAMRRSGSYVVAFSRLNHAGQRQFIVSNISFNYPAAFLLDEEHQIQYNIKEPQQNITLKQLVSNKEYFVFDESNQRFGFFNSTTDSLTFSHPHADGNYTVQQMDAIYEIKHINKTSITASNPSEENSFTIITSKRLYQQIANQNSIDDYVDWRSSSVGGSYNTRLYFIEDLYDEYGYGVRRHPIALNNFSEVLRNSDPDGQLLIIGKGRAYSLTRTEAQLNSDKNTSFFVPSLGFPSSDPLSISPIGQIKPRLSCGRLAISTMEEVGTYLNNVKQYETLASTIPSTENNWKKKIIHLSGGNAQANTVRKVFDQMSARIQRTAYAPEITTFYKNGTIPVDSSQSDQIYRQINNGASIVTFFGHSAPNTLGFRIDNENNYANAPLYPLFIALGCSAGNYNISSKSVGENYCLMENKGFLNLISSTSISIIFNLDSVGRSLYEFIGSSDNSLSHGQLLNKTIDQVGLSTNGRRQAGQLSLFGDPSIKLNYHQEVDVTIDKTSIGTNPSIISIATDSIDFEFDLINLGRNPSQDVFVSITRTDVDGNLSSLFNEFVSLEGYRTPINIRIPIDRENFTGQNRLLVDIDNGNLIEELLFADSELNNSYIHSDNKPGYPLFIPNDGMTAIWPRDKSIIPSTDVVFFANSGNLLSSAREYYFEVDTTTSFDSPLHQQLVTNSVGGVIDFSPAFTFSSNKVYYWRVSPPPDSLSGEYYWTPHQSFIVIPNKEGWNISHYHQFVETHKNGLELLSNQNWSFTKDFIPIRFGNGIWNSEYQDQLGWFEFNHPFPTSSSLAWEVGKEALGVIAFDHVNNRLVNSAGGIHGSIPIDGDKDYFAFENTIAGRDSLIAFIKDIVPSNFNILFFTIRSDETDTINTSDWQTDSIRNHGVNIYNLLEGYGATKIRQTSSSNQASYLSYFNKNDGFRFEDITFDNDLLSVDFNIKNLGNHGDISLSNDIILRSDQSMLKWKFDHAVDSFDVYRIYSKIPANSAYNYLSNNNLNDSISINQLSDSIRFLGNYWSEISDANFSNPRPAQAEYFRMYGDVIGDYAIAPNILYDGLKPIYDIAESISGSIAILNIHHSIEELPLRVYATHLSTNQEIEFTNEVLAIESNETINLNFDGILTIAGEYLVTIKINPDRIFSEATFFNNVLNIPILIRADKSPPRLDVTFDGVRIFHDQIVSPTSTINIDLIDENKYILLDKTEFLHTNIQQPDGSSYNIVVDDNAEFTIPTSLNNNTLTLKIDGNFEQEGTYSISIVGRDASGNKNQIAYKVDFQVFHKTGFGVKFRPNPVVDELFIDYILLGHTQSQQLELYINNVVGQTVLSTAIPIIEGHHQYRIIIPAEWPSGLYQYKVVVKGEDGGVFTEYTDSNLGFVAGARSGQFILVREEH